ncbi:MAG: hypothetical protein NVSMB10_07000 [Steroidobacteraceae bacterium]
MRMMSAFAFTAYLAGSAGALASIPATVPSAAVAPPRQDVRGIWKQKKFSFQFMGFTSTYSCDGLAHQLRTLLLAAGARSDLKAQPGVCATGFDRPDKFASADLTFYVLVPPDTVASTPEPAAAPGDGEPGAWVSIEIAAHKPMEISTGDCELVDQFRTQVLPLLTIRHVENHTSCIPHQDSGSNIDLRFESFTALKARPHGAGKAVPH